ncbi:MAG TPA: hypothetical protein VGM03_01120 [Phycisphaerae bacterium]|jgi:hypothetical protein
MWFEGCGAPRKYATLEFLRETGTLRVTGGNVSGATTPMLTVNPVGLADAGRYDCLVTLDACGIAVSSDAVLTVPVDIVSANPPADNPYIQGQQPFRDALQNTTAALAMQGIGVDGTPGEGPYTYAPLTITFSGTPSPTPGPGNIAVDCTDIAGNGPADCPAVTVVYGVGAGPYLISLSAPPPARECATFMFAGTSVGQKLQYQVLPGDTNLDGAVSTQDLLFLVQRMNDGTANLPENRARYNINRSNETGGTVVNTQDLLRLVQLLNGVNTTQAFNGATVAACP